MRSFGCQLLESAVLGNLPTFERVIGQLRNEEIERLLYSHIALSFVIIYNIAGITDYYEYVFGAGWKSVVDVTPANSNRILVDLSKILLTKKKYSEFVDLYGLILQAGEKNLSLINSYFPADTIATILLEANDELYHTSEYFINLSTSLLSTSLGKIVLALHDYKVTNLLIANANIYKFKELIGSITLKSIVENEELMRQGSLYIDNLIKSETYKIFVGLKSFWNITKEFLDRTRLQISHVAAAGMSSATNEAYLPPNISMTFNQNDIIMLLRSSVTGDLEEFKKLVYKLDTLSADHILYSQMALLFAFMHQSNDLVLYYSNKLGPSWMSMISSLPTITSKAISYCAELLHNKQYDIFTEFYSFFFKDVCVGFEFLTAEHYKALADILTPESLYFNVPGLNKPLIICLLNSNRGQRIVAEIRKSKLLTIESTACPPSIMARIRRLLNSPSSFVHFSREETYDREEFAVSDDRSRLTNSRTVRKNCATNEQSCAMLIEELRSLLLTNKSGDDIAQRLMNVYHLLLQKKRDKQNVLEFVKRSIDIIDELMFSAVYMQLATTDQQRLQGIRGLFSNLSWIDTTEVGLLPMETKTALNKKSYVTKVGKDYQASIYEQCMTKPLFHDYKDPWPPVATTFASHIADIKVKRLALAATTTTANPYRKRLKNSD